jgi:predicted O-methyltransferase YrrM
MLITKETLSSLNLKQLVDPLLKEYSVEQNELFGVPGREHYTLLAYLSSLHEGSTIIDIGTHRGSSALSLSTSLKTTIYSFDIQRKVFLRDLPNVNYELADLWDATVFAHWEETIMNSAIILLDVDPHNGTMEYELYLRLKEKGYKGLIVCDDIWYFKEMRDKFWFKIPSSEKVDITCLGHWSGTGVISFVPRPDIQWETFAGLRTIGAEPAAQPYTVCTAYFDLTKMEDASPSIKKRTKDYYLEHAKATFALDQPLVVFCETESLENVRALRPTHLMEKTRFYTVDFESLPMTKYRDVIAKNRVRHPYRGDERNTPSYYLLCMARYALMKRVMDENPFQSTHFAWLNVCIERMGYTNLLHLDEVFSTVRDKVSTTYIDYIPKSALEPVSTYYEFGRCSLCSGFFTGGKKFLYEFCDRIEKKFLHYLHLGYGHADEQLYSPVYFDAPELFDVYYGDYSSMITNYAAAYEKRMPLGYVIPKSAAASDWATCIHACRFVWNSVAKGACSLSEDERRGLLTNYCKAAFELPSHIPEMRANGALAAFFALNSK